MQEETKQVITWTYLTQRKVIGILGMLLGFAVVLMNLLFGDAVLRGSISAYYYSNAHDIFVGLLVAAGMFLLSYRGYEPIDRLITAILGISAITTALFPCGLSVDNQGLFGLTPGASSLIHFISAGIFFAGLIYNSMFLFTKSSGVMTEGKKKRNMVYTTCGWVMIGGFVLTLIGNFIPGPIVLIAEIIMLCAFGVSWLVKGEAILKDAQ